MSKKTRKNPPRASSGRSGAAASSKTKSVKTRRRVATKSLKKSTTAGSHRGSSKPLRSAVATGKQRKAHGNSDPNAQRLDEGANAPEFRLPRDGGGTVSLSDYTGKQLVLFFFPRADTPGCTREAIDFTRLAPEFAKAGTAILGISADPPKTQEAFREKHRLSIPLLSDDTHEVLAAYGAWGEKSLYGRRFLGILRTTVLIGPDGHVRKIWRNVRVDGHAEQVLAAARDT